MNPPINGPMYGIKLINEHKNAITNAFEIPNESNIIV